jgi:glycosyltransferase involved in cell wall biosynthesis
MARILFLTELLPYPLVSGAKIRAYFVLKHLARRHRVTLLSFTRPEDSPEDIAHLSSFLDRAYTVPMQRSLLRDVRAGLVSVTTGLPAIIAREEIAAMRRKVLELLATGRFDAVHADQIPMARYGLLPAPAGSARIPRVLDQHNATFRLLERFAANEPRFWKRALLRREASAFARYEPEICRRYDHVAFVTAEDRRTLEGRMGPGSLDGRSSVIPICVDTEAVAPATPAASPHRVTLLGTMFWPPNIEGFDWFHRNVWPAVLAGAPAARLTAIGKRPPERLLALHGREGVEVPGYVPDLTPCLAETAAFIVPLLSAGGMRVKIVDAWCRGLPVVSTSIGVEGIECRDGENILLADTPEAFASSLLRVLTEPSLNRALRANGRRWVEQRYEWRRVYGAWDEIYDGLLPGQHAPCSI